VIRLPGPGLRAFPAAEARRGNGWVGALLRLSAKKPAHQNLGQLPQKEGYCGVIVTDKSK
jgi:hypothetical protein